MNVLNHLELLVAGLAGFAVWPNISRRGAVATPQIVGGVRCDFRQTRASRSNQVTITVVMPCDERFEFTLRRERSFDRLAKALRLVREFQTQDERFDRAVYIGADERGVHEWLAQDAQARRDFLNLLALKAQEYTEITAISASRGALKLSALAKPPIFNKAPDGLAGVVAKASIPAMKSCLDRLEAFAASGAAPSAFHDPYAVAVRTLTSMGMGLLLVPVLLSVLLDLQAPRVELATNPFTDKVTFVAPAFVVCTLMAVGIPLLRGSARLHTVLTPLLVFGVLGALLTGRDLIHEVNQEWDTSAPQRYSTRVLDRYVTSGKNKTYHVWVADWHFHKDHQDFRVDTVTYNSLSAGDTLVVSERDGYLGMPWVSDLSRDSPRNDGGD